MADHARLSPSASKIWMACAGFPTLAEGCESTSSSYAERGTAAHDLLEQRVKLGRWLGPTAKTYPANNGVELNQEDIDAVKVAYDFIWSEIEHGDDWESETRLVYNDDLWGTSDFSRYRPSTGELLVVDYKHGSGVPVEAKDNPQGVIYALMKAKALGNRGISKIRFVIVQPRGYHADGPIREFAVDGFELLEWEDRIVEAMGRVEVANDCYNHADWAELYLKTGDHCRWCNAAAICPAKRDQAVTALQESFDPVSTTDVAKLAENLKLVPQLKAWAEAVDKFAYAEAERGVEIPGFKLVPKRPTQRWKPDVNPWGLSQEFAVPAADLVTEPELKSPAQVRALIEPNMPGATKKARTEAAKTNLDQFTETTSSGSTLVPVEDPRAPIRQSAADDFSAVD